MGLGPLLTVTQGKTSDTVYEILREHIVSNHSVPRERLKPAAIGSRMGISHIPLQQALNPLAVEGLIQTVARKGTYVTRPMRKKIQETSGIGRIAYAPEAGLHRQAKRRWSIEQLC